MAGKRLSPVELQRILEMRRRGYSQADIALAVKRNRSTVMRVLSGQHSSPDLPTWRKAPAGLDTSESTGSFNGAARSDKAAENYVEAFPAPKITAGQLTPQAKDALADFALFNEVYFGESLYDYQKEWVRLMLDTDHAMVMAAPRHGKTEVFSVRLPTWLLCGGGHPRAYYDDPSNPLRDAQVLLASATKTQAGKNLRAIAARLQRNVKIRKDFGRFRDPDAPWRESELEIMVAGRRTEILSGDWSLRCCGVLEPNVLGIGSSFILLDDPANLSNCRGDEQLAKLMATVRGEIMSRMEPGAKIFVMGATLPLPRDLYSELERICVVDGEGEDPDEEPEEGTEKLFTVVRQPAVLDWATKLILSPRFTWSEIVRTRARLGRVAFDSMWQQSRTAAGVSLCAREWIYGENDFPGCLDIDRSIGEGKLTATVEGESVPTTRVLSIDPSPTMYVGAILMDVPVTRSLHYSPIVVDLERAKMRAPDMVGLMREWHGRYGYSTLIFEQNAAQRFLLQSAEFQSFRRSSRVRVIEHQTTGQNKPDPNYGVQTLAADVERGFVRIPWAGMKERAKMGYLIRELLQEVPTDDLLMALWFPKWHMQGLVSGRSDNGFRGMGSPGRSGSIGPPPRLAALR
ncbi:MAG: helix-turn-helix domain-containing protein [Ilumatobacteraceae bacterium]